MCGCGEGADLVAQPPNTHRELVHDMLVACLPCVCHHLHRLVSPGLQEHAHDWEVAVTGCRQEGRETIIPHPAHVRARLN